MLYTDEYQFSKKIQNQKYVCTQRKNDPNTQENMRLKGKERHQDNNRRQLQHLPAINRQLNQIANQCKNTSELNKMLQSQGSKEIFTQHFIQQLQNTHSSHQFVEHWYIAHTVSHKLEIISCVFSDYNRTKLEINGKNNKNLQIHRNGTTF